MKTNAERMRRSFKRLIDINRAAAVISRQALEDNGRGSFIPAGNPQTHSITCRISHEGGGVWKYGQWDGGLSTNKTKFLITESDTDIKENDILTIADGSKFRIGAVSCLEIQNEFYGKQAELFKAD